MSESQPSVPGVNGSRRRVAVVFGGTSSEHGVSCLTAAGVLEVHWIGIALTWSASASRVPGAGSW